MKKIICLCTIVVMMLGLFACETEQGDSAESATREVSSTSSGDNGGGQSGSGSSSQSGDESSSQSSSGSEQGGETVIADGTVFKLTLDNQGAKTAGSAQIFLKYNVGYYLDKNGTKSITDETGAITIPVKTGFAFLGYNVKKDGSGQTIITSDGLLDLGAGYADFEADGTLYAQWEKVSEHNIYYYNTKDVTNENPTTFTESEDVTLKNLSLTGWTFNGWFDASTDGNKVIGWGAWIKTADVSLWARWTANTYTVTLSNDGNTKGTESVTATFNENLPNITIPTKVGFQFAGYWTETGGKGMQYVDKDGKGCRIWNLAADTMLYADWLEKDGHSITYIGADGCENTNPTTFKEYQTVTIQNITRTGYNFGGWWTQAEGGEKVSSWVAGSKTDDITLYARWTAKTYTVTLSNDGSYKGTESVSATFDANLSNITIPAKAGFQFAGYWTEVGGKGTKYIDKDGQGCKKWDFTANTTLYADWLENGGHFVIYIGVDDCDNSLNPTSFKESQNITLQNITKTGYSFGGWWTQAEGGERVSSWAAGSKTADVTLYARWTAKTYTVTLNNNGGTSGSQSLSAAFDTILPSIIAPTRIGYQFDGYYTTANGEGTQYIDKDGNGVTEWNIDNNTTLYAKWIENDPHSITYLGVGNVDNSLNPTSFKESQSVTLQNISKIGYTFDGWYDAENGGTIVTGWIAGTYTDDVTLWARWTAITYTVSFNSNGGSGFMQPMTFSYDESQNLTACSFTAPTGMKFGTWNTKADGTGISYTAAQSVINLTDKNETVILYAQWEEKESHQIVYNNLKSAGNSYNPSTFRETQNIILQDISLQGWIFNGWWTAAEGGSKVSGWNQGEKTEDVTLWARWTANTVNYTVKKYFQTVSGDCYEQNLSQYPNQIKTGRTETTTNATAEDNVTGFNLQQIEQQTIAGDGLTVVNVYYNRKTITYTFNSNGAKWSDGTTGNKTVSGLYGGEVDMSSVIIKGWSYTWNDTIPSVFGSVDKTFTAQCSEKKWENNTTGDIVYGNTVYLKTSMVTVLEQSTSITCDQASGVFPSARGSVTLGKYAIGKYPVTQELYNAVMRNNPSRFDSSTPYTNGEITETNVLLRPVEYVRWYEAIVFCNKLSTLMGKTRCYKLSNGAYPEYASSIPTSNDSKWDYAECDCTADGYRLPTECEWECAARGGVYSTTTPWTYTYSGSDTIEDVAWCSSNSSNHTWEVGLKAPNSLGIYDMTGNVKEWCWDKYSSAAIDGSTPVTGPTRNDSAFFSRRIRGSDYSSGSEEYTEVSYRTAGDPYYHAQSIGFRLVCSGD